jgi:hypothetical protein
VFNQDGQLSAAIIGVGGFLGVGEKNVAVDFSQLKMVIAHDNTERWVLETTREALNTAPAFEWNDQAQPVQQTEMAAATPAPDDQTAMTTGIESSTETAANPNAPAAPMETYSAEGMTAIDVANITADQLQGTRVIGPENTQIAEVGDIVLTGDGTIDALLVDFGGFLGIGEKRVAVGVDNLQFLTDENGTWFVWLNVTKEQLDQAQAYDQNTYTQQRDQQRLVTSAS